jgi:hypothetical protein
LIGIKNQAALKQWNSHHAQHYVRYGSKADITPTTMNDRFVPQAAIKETRAGKRCNKDLSGDSRFGV